MTSRWLSLGLATLALAQSGSGTTVHAAASAQLSTVPPRAARPQPAPQPARAPIYLAKRIDELGQSFKGRVGIAVQSIDDGWVTSWNGNELNPQQSVS